MNRTFTATLLVVSAMIATACSQKTAPKSANSLPAPGAATPIGRYGSAETVAAVSQEDLRQAAGSDRVLFGTDSDVLDEQDKEILRRQAEWLARHPTVNVTIEGHCDERGTRDYNIALGERRANAAKNHLGGLGVDAARMRVVSFGKERPEALGSDEEAWAQNRRAVTVIIR